MTATIDPDVYDAVLFDLDGVITDTASVHLLAWTEMFDDYLARRAARTGGEAADARPFTAADYHRHVDGKLRQDGVAAFLASRGIDLPPGSPADGPEQETIHGLGNRKDGYYLRRIAAGGVVVFGSTVALVRALRAAGVATGVFSASRNCRQVLESAGLSELFAVRVDGVVAEDLGLPGKPDPATLLEAARRLGTSPSHAVVVEDALSGVEAGRRGGFGYVIGVDRAGQAARLRDHGADVVVADLGEVGVGPTPTRPESEVPAGPSASSEVVRRVGGGPAGVVLDLDDRLERLLGEPGGTGGSGGPAVALRAAVATLTAACPVAVLADDADGARRRVGASGVSYASRPAEGGVSGADQPSGGAAAAESARATAAGPDRGEAVREILAGLSPAGRRTPVYVGGLPAGEGALRVVAATGLGIVVRDPGSDDRRTCAHVAADDAGALAALLDAISRVQATSIAPAPDATTEAMP